MSAELIPPPGVTGDSPAGSAASAAATEPLDQSAVVSVWAPVLGKPHHPLIHNRRPRSSRALFARWRDLLAIYVGRRLDPVFRESIMLSVAAADTSRQCGFAHREWAIAEGISKEQLVALEHMDADKFDERTWAALRWAQATALADFGPIPDTIDRSFRAHYSKREQSDIALQVQLMYWMNETSNGVDAAWSRMTGKPAAGSLLRDIEALLMYALFVPYVLAIISKKQRRTPSEIVKGMKPFFRDFQSLGR